MHSQICRHLLEVSIDSTNFFHVGEFMRRNSKSCHESK